MGRWMSELALGVGAQALGALELAAHLESEPTRVLEVGIERMELMRCRMMMQRRRLRLLWLWHMSQMMSRWHGSSIGDDWHSTEMWMMVRMMMRMMLLRLMMRWHHHCWRAVMMSMTGY